MTALSASRRAAPPGRVRFAFVRLVVRAIQLRDRRRLLVLARRHPGLEIHPEASTNLAVARFDLAPGARLRVERGVVAERVRDGVRFVVGEGAEITVGEGSWLKCDVEKVHLVAFPGGSIAIGALSFLQGCHVSAKQRVTLGRQVMIGFGARVFDSSQHPIDDDRPEEASPVEIRDCSWIAADATVLAGTTVGPHSVVGSRSVVTRSIGPHTLAAGAPAKPQGTLGDRWNCSGVVEGA